MTAPTSAKDAPVALTDEALRELLAKAEHIEDANFSIGITVGTLRLLATETLSLRAELTTEREAHIATAAALQDARARLAQAEEALDAIARHKGKTLISVEHGQPYSIGANAAFEEMAALAETARSQMGGSK